MQHDWTLDPAHPALAGHFPGHPVAPGVVVLARMVAVAEAEAPGMACTGVRKMKFLRPLNPGETLAISCDAARSGAVRVRAAVGTEMVAEGQLMLAAREGGR